MTARALSALAMVCAAVAAGCTEIATGTAVKAPGGAGDASVAQMDTGSYPTTAGPPIGSAADDPQAAAAEARRMAGYVVGPWQVEASLRDLDFYATAPIPDTAKVMMTLSLPFTPISWGMRSATSPKPTRSSRDSKAAARAPVRSRSCTTW